MTSAETLKYLDMNVPTAFLCSNLHLRASNNGSSKTSPEQVSAFIYRIALNGGEAQFLDELTAQVRDYHLGGPNLCRLRPNLLPIFLLWAFKLATICGGGRGSVCAYLLADIREEADDLIALLQKPFQDTRRIKTARVGEADFSLGRHFLQIIRGAWMQLQLTEKWGWELKELDESTPSSLTLVHSLWGNFCWADKISG